MRHCVALLVLAVLVLGAELTFAKPNQRAVQLVRESMEHYEAGRFNEALSLLSEASKISDDPTIVYNTARVYESLGDLPAAIRNYRAYLQRAPNAPDRGAVEARVQVLEKQIEERNELARKAADKPPAEARADQEPTPKAGLDSTAKAARSPLPWITVGVGGAVLATGAVLGWIAREKHAEAEDTESASKAHALNGEVDDFSAAANVAFIAGGVIVVAGLSWVLLDGSSANRTAPAALSLSVGPRSALVKGRF